MRRFYSSFLNFIPQPTWKSHSHLLKRGEIVPGTTIERYRARLAKLIELLPPDCTAIVQSYPTNYPYQQNNNMLYLTGFNEHDSSLVIQLNGRSPTVSLFVTKNSEHSMLWSGPVAGIEGAKEIFGFENVHDYQEFDAFLKSLKGTVFMDSEGKSITSKPLAPLLQELRIKKTPEEIALLSRSGEIAAESFSETMKFSKEATSEAELAAFFEFKCRSKEAERLAYVPVVAGGNRGLVLHYTHNNQLLPKNDMVLMDAGCLHFGYCSDITRTWPLSSRFTAPQRALYEAVLRVQQNCLEALKKFPNRLTFSQLNDLAMHFTATELDRLHFRRIEHNISRWFPHSIGHHLGLDLHDCPLRNRFDARLTAGNVITVEPGLYIANDDQDALEEYRGLAVRIEDDVVLQADGIKIMTEGVPKHPDEIESLLNS